ncbi:alpha/beta hydrolase [Mycolicibacterium mageritense]|uniref:alpha/beta hydrolase n=1 Tax=Mycolicibacterium mageritense TaxID=53462 RepID=UPI0035B59E9C
MGVADIDRWNTGDVREVFRAAQGRADSSGEASDGMGRLPAFETWGGQASDAAKGANGKRRADLDAQGKESIAVARAATAAADGIDAVKNTLAELREKASQMGMALNAQTNTFERAAGSTLTAEQMLTAMLELQPELNAVLADANKVDEELANAIKMATGAEPIPDAPHDNRPEIQEALSKPLPEDPNEFHALWEQLTDEEKDWVYANDHSIGNHPGMPFVDRDHYNRLHLGEMQQANQTEIDRLTAAHPDWAAGKKPFFASNEWKSWKAQWDTAHRSQQEFAQVQKALESPDGLPRFLGIVDDRGHAAVSINDPDAAKRNATFVPGTGQDLSRFEFSTDKSKAMYEATMSADRSLRPGDVSVTTWMGYDRPMSVIPEAASTSYAHNGAGALEDFQAGLRASHDNAGAGGPSVNTVIGHSYGSTLMGAAALDGYLDANNVVAVGSPGVLAEHASDLNLPADSHVFATRAQNDIIGAVTSLTLGPDPMSSKFGGIPFEAAPGPAWPLGLPSVAAHSSYWDNMNNPALINLGRIIAGRTDVTPPTFTP